MVWCKAGPRRLLSLALADWARCIQIYSGYMERKFVPVEQRGKGQANGDSTAPSHTDGQEPHGANTDAKAGTGTLVLCMLA